MRIVSKFKDYYDGCIGYGYDSDSALWIRNELAYDHSDTNEQIKELYLKITEATETKPNVYLSTTVDIIRFYVLFCGKVYCGVKVNNQGQNPRYFYKKEQLLEYMVDAGKGEDLLKKWFDRNRILNIHKYQDFINGMFGVKGIDRDWAIANKVTAAVLVVRRNQGWWDMLINPCLKGFEFFKVFDPFTTYQELDMWVSGTLSYPHNMMIEIEDKYKIEGKGFDTKYGFRTRPSNK